MSSGAASGVPYTSRVGAGEPAGTRWWLGGTLAVAALLQLVVVNAWPRFDSPNERGRAYQAIAVASRGSLDISPELERFGTMEDVAAFGGRRFPNKAPGVLPLVVPGALLARAAGGGPAHELASTLFLGRLLAASLPFALTVLLLARAAVPRYPRGGPLAVVAYALATPALAASLVLFSHALTACLLLAAFLLLLDSERPGWRAAALAGALLGWAAACEYSAALPGAIVVAAALPRLRARGLVAAVAGAAVPAALLAAYDAACFGSPLSIASAHETYATFAGLSTQGFMGISMPTLSGIAGLLISTARGLLVWAPLAAFALPAACARSNWPTDRWGRLALWSAPLALLLAMSGYPNWHGGWFPGPRYLLPVLPLVFLLAARWAELVLADPRGRVIAGAAALWGLAMAWPCLATFPFPPEDVPLPALTLAPGLLAQGIRTPSWLPAAVVVPAVALVALCAGAALLAVATPTGSLAERAATLGVLAAAIAAAAFVSYPATWQASLERAVIHDVYGGGPPGALEALAPRAETLLQRRQVEAWIDRRGAPLVR